MSGPSLMAIIRWAGRQVIANRPAKNVLNAIATYADRTGYAHPSQRELAAQTGFSERAVRMALAMLEEDGFIKREVRRRGNGSRTSDGLQLLLDREANNRHDVPVVEAAITGTTCQAPRNPVPTSPARDSGPTTFEQPGEQPRERSDPGGSAPGAGAGLPNFRFELFDRGTRELHRLTGRSPEKCRARIGSWRGLAGDDAAEMAAIDAAAEAEVLEPIAWIEARLKQRRQEAAGRPMPAAPAVLADRTAQAARMAERGEWPTGGGIFVAADSPEGEAWAAHYARFGVRPKWIPMPRGVGWNMPSPRPPAGA